MRSEVQNENKRESRKKKVKTGRREKRMKGERERPLGT